MKTAVIAIVSCLAVSVAQGYPANEGNLDETNTIIPDCIAESKVNLSVLDRARKGDFTEDNKLKNHIFCISKKVGFQDQDGKLAKGTTLYDIVLKIAKDKPIADKIMAECLFPEKSPPDIAFYGIKCAHKINGIVIY